MEIEHYANINREEGFSLSKSWKPLIRTWRNKRRSSVRKSDLLPSLLIQKTYLLTFLEEYLILLSSPWHWTNHMHFPIGSLLLLSAPTSSSTSQHHTSPWKWRRQGPLKHWYWTTRHQGVTTHNSTWTVTFVDIVKIVTLCIIQPIPVSFTNVQELNLTCHQNMAFPHLTS